MIRREDHSEVWSPSGKKDRRPCKEHLDGNCTNPSGNIWHPLLCQNYKSKSGCRFGHLCAFLQRRLMVSRANVRKRAVERHQLTILKGTGQLVCVIQNNELPKSRTNFWKSTQFVRPKRCVRFTKCALRYLEIRERSGPLLAVIKPTSPHGRSCYAPIFEEHFQEETSRHERCARRDAQELANSNLKLKEKDTATFLSASDV